jgi:hypothetical protein
MNNDHTSLYDEPTTQYSHEFWNNYGIFLLKQGVKKSLIKWYVLNTKRYVATFPDKQVRDHQPENVEHYFHSAGQNQSLETWKYLQIIDAIKTLFTKSSRVSWANDFDWEYYRTSAKQLERTHPTVKRDYNNDLEHADIFEGKPYNPDAKQRYQPEINQVIRVIRNKNYAMRTEKTYCHWIARFFYFHQPENVKTLGTKEVHQYLEYLVLKRNVSVSTQKQALNALAFLFSKVWDKPLGELKEFTRSKRPKHLPTVLSREEVRKVLKKPKAPSP